FAFLALGHWKGSQFLGLTPQLLDTLLAGDGLARAFARAGVGARPLATDRQTPPVPYAPITADVPQPCNVLLDLPAQRAFDGVFPVEDTGQPANVVVGQLLGPALRIDVGLFTQAQGQRRPDAVDVTQRDVRRLVVGDVYTQDTRHGLGSSRR